MTGAAVAVRERPLIMSGPMVRAILDGRKSQTRRVVRPENSEFGAWGAPFWKHADLSQAWVDGKGSGSEYLKVPIHEPGCSDDCRLMEGVVDRLRPRIAPARCWDQTPEPSERYVPPASRLWVRESLYKGALQWHYHADAKPVELDADDQSVPAMVSWAHHKNGVYCPSIHMPRWASRITLEITNVRVERLNDITEADAEAEGVEPDTSDLRRWGPYKSAFAFLWQTLNAKRAPWASNPWVWAISFARATP